MVAVFTPTAAMTLCWSTCRCSVVLRDGCGPICAETIIGQSGDVGRFASRAHFASYNATAPIEASSGNSKRHRLKPKGNRQLNWAIHVIAGTQLRNPGTEGRIYFDRKVAEGKTNKEALRR